MTKNDIIYGLTLLLIGTKGAVANNDSNMQAMTSPLDNLHDIITPKQNQINSLATIDYVLIAISMCALLALTALIYRRIKRQRLQAKIRLGEAELNNIPFDSLHYAIEFNCILKRVALSYRPRLAITTLDDEQWLAWMKQLISKKQQQQIDFTLFALALGQRYQRQPLNPQQAQQLLSHGKRWLHLATPALSRVQTTKPANGRSRC